ncbi:MAG: outer membrane lipid asymmetry maintenance protein MlaD [Nevskia sp.]|nr:outer membrane lipid asymmetry maintenance protein MlaD [Nevskia sp.]
MHSRSLEVLVGFFVCLGVAAMFVLTLRVASLETVGTGANNYDISARFDTIGSLVPGASVKIAGVKIGRVRGIAIDPQSFQAVVTMEIDGRQNNIPADSTAKVLTAGLLGEQYVGLEAGGDEKSLKNGDEIRYTQSALVLENLIGQFLTSMTQKSSQSGGSGAQQPAPAAAAPKSK